MSEKIKIIAVLIISIIPLSFGLILLWEDRMGRGGGAVEWGSLVFSEDIFYGTILIVFSIILIILAGGLIARKKWSWYANLIILSLLFSFSGYIALWMFLDTLTSGFFIVPIFFLSLIIGIFSLKSIFL